MTELLRNPMQDLQRLYQKSVSGFMGSLDELDKKKFLCPGDITVGQFQFVIRYLDRVLMTLENDSN